MQQIPKRFSISNVSYTYEHVVISFKYNDSNKNISIPINNIKSILNITEKDINCDELSVIIGTSKMLDLLFTAKLLNDDGTQEQIIIGVEMQYHIFTYQ